MEEVLESVAADFLSKLEREFTDFLFDTLYDEEAKGLNCDRDTEEEVETAIRYFPNVLSEVPFMGTSRVAIFPNGDDWVHVSQKQPSSSSLLNGV